MRENKKGVYIEKVFMEKAWKRVKGKTFKYNSRNYLDMKKAMQDPDAYVDEIYSKILSGQFTPGKVNFIDIRNKESKRTIGLLALEDQIVHNAIKFYLEDKVLPYLNKRSYAYQPKKSAIHAVNSVEKKLNNFKWILRTDIKGFFDTIDHRILKKELFNFIAEDEIIDFIVYLFHQQEIGIIQGSPLSPLLSNVYLNSFDSEYTHKGYSYYRFSDDILIMSKDAYEIKDLLKNIKQSLDKLKLELNDEKTSIVEINEGFQFLGYNFSTSGKSVSTNSIASLNGNLSNIFVEDEDRWIKYKEVLRGWEQYYQTIPWLEIENIEVCLLACSFNVRDRDLAKIYSKLKRNLKNSPVKPEYIEYLLNMSTRLNNSDDTMYWIHLGLNQDFPKDMVDKILKDRFLLNEIQLNKVKRFIRNLNKITVEGHSEFVEWAIEENLFLIAQAFHKLPTYESIDIANTSESSFYDLFYHLFSGREDQFMEETLSRGKRLFTHKDRPLHVNDVKAHLKGEKTIVQYLTRMNNTVNYVLFDIDIRSDIVTKYKNNFSKMIEYKKLALEDAIKIITAGEKYYLQGYLVDSGYRGYHIWFFFKEPIPISDAYEFLVELEKNAESRSKGIVWERFPKQRKLKKFSLGQAIRLPFGKHAISKRQSCFVEWKGQVISNQREFLKTIKRIPRDKVLSVIYPKRKERLPNSKRVFPKSVLNIVEGCSVIEHMYNKAKETKYLGHQERLLFLNVFAPTGKVGQSFIHEVMSHTMNYNPDKTQGFINRAYSKPISCVRVREHFPTITAQLPCNCKFKDSGGCYPSPVLHSVDFKELPKVSNKRYKNKANEEIKKDEDIEVKQKINELATRIIDLRKNQRGISRSLKENEMKLKKYFDELNVNEYEINLGVLKREEKSGKYVWSIRL